MVLASMAKLRVENITPAESKLKQVHPDAAPLIAIFGGHGNKDSVSTISYPRALAKIQKTVPNATFIAVDPIVGTERGKQIIADQAREFDKHGFHYVGSFHPDEFYRNLERGSISIDGAVLAVPVKHHLPETKRLLDASGKPFSIMVEKPLGFRNQLDEFKKIHQDPAYQGRIYAADFSDESVSLKLALNKLLGEIGNPRTVAARFTQKEPLNDLIREIQDRGLLWTKHSGGGMGLDMGVHTLFAEELIFQKLTGLSLGKAKINNVHLGAIDHPGIESHRDPDAETYWRADAILNGIEIKNDAGKGLEYNNYLIQLEGDKGNLAMSLGTRTHSPYVLLHKHNEAPKLFLFPPAVRYSGIFEDFILMALGRSDLVEGMSNRTMDAALASVGFVGDSYEIARAQGIEVGKIPFGTTPEFSGRSKINDLIDRTVAEQLAKKP